jgi:hypothetical protein
MVKVLILFRKKTNRKICCGGFSAPLSSRSGVPARAKKSLLKPLPCR